MIHFRLEYNTEWGERIVMKAGKEVLNMVCETAGQWKISLPRAPKDYSYQLMRGADCIRTEWRGHRLEAVKESEVQVFDRWIDRPADSPFHTSMFKDVVFRRTVRKSDGRKGNVTFMLPCPQVRPDQALAITGSGALFEDWKKMHVLGDEDFPLWETSLEVTEPFEYKFVIVDRKTHVPIIWENGFNRLMDPVPGKDSHFVLNLGTPSFNLRPWKGAGTAVPVFSLRTADSFGIGEFNDLKKLVDWAVATGQNLIQLLPINDTTMTGKWQDSYPYNANTTFALHPQFIHLPDAGVKEDKTYRALRDELNALPALDYERVNNEKRRLLEKAWKKQEAGLKENREYLSFVRSNSEWLLPYAVFCCLRDEFGTAEFGKWGDYAKYTKKKVMEYAAANPDRTGFYFFEQYLLDRQLKEAVEYAHTHGVGLKGDLPIGISRTSVDAWAHPALFHLDSQAGAPPDAFSTFGQNWGFPTYNWERMSRDGFAWWKARMRKMGEYFDAFRIDHILGFFRIWEIPMSAVHGLLGHFNPALPYSAGELEETGFKMDGRYTVPQATDNALEEIFGELAGEVKARYVKNGVLVPEVDTQRKVLEKFTGSDDHGHKIMEGLMTLLDDVLFVEDPGRPGWYHPRISAQSTRQFKALDDNLKRRFNDLYTDFFYRRHNEFWKRSAMAKLPTLLDSMDMLTCGEDLGMIPDCVPEVMHELNILSLEIQRMPKALTEEFDDPARYPYYCVCATGTHDTSTLRAWWEEDREASARFYHGTLGCGGDAPYFCEPWVCEKIVSQHLHSPAMLCVLPLQDWLSIDGKIRYQGDPADERINIPAIPRHYWRYRMHMNLEDLIAQTGFNDHLRNLIQGSRRNI